MTGNPPPLTPERPARAAASLGLVRQLLDAASDPMAVIDGGSRLVLANAAWAERAGDPGPNADEHRPPVVAGAPAPGALPSAGAPLVGLPLLAPLGIAADASIHAALHPASGRSTLDCPGRDHLGRPCTWRLRSEPLQPAPDVDEPLWLVVLENASAGAALRDDHRRLSTLLELARHAGRLATWERELPFGEGRWDAEMHALYGLDPAGGTPSFEDAARYVHPDDVRLARHTTASLTPGRYEMRFRISRPDGQMRRLHSVWQITPAEDGQPSRALGIALDDTDTWLQAQDFRAETARLRTAVALGNIGIWQCDFADQRYRLNAVASALLGFDGEALEVDAATLGLRLHPDDMRSVQAADRVALEHDIPSDVTCRYRRADGEWRELLTRRVVQRDGNGRAIGFVGIVLDFEQQARSARRSLELARRLDLAARAAGIGIWSHVDGQRSVEWNDQMRVLLGLPVDEPPPALRDWVMRCVHPDDRDTFLREALGWLHGPAASLDQTFRVLRPDGSVRWLTGRARCEPMRDATLRVGVMHDITEHRAALNALHDAYERAALTARGAGIATWDRGIDDAAAAWDDQMYRLRGLDPRHGPFTDAGRHALVHPEDLPRIARLQARAALDRQLVSYEFRVRLPDGGWRWLASRAMPVSDEHGRVQRMIGVNWDITDTRNAEEGRRAKEIALRESQAKSQFLARISHELRTPLNAVLGFTQLMQADEDGSSPTRAARLAHIRSGGEHLLTLIDEVLDLSSLESGQLKLELAPVPVGDVLREALPLVQQLARRHQVTIEAGRVDGIAVADRTRLRQVLINLLSNAIKYNRPRGRVVVRGETDDDGLVLHVSDTGRGMSREQMAQLFQPFNRLGIEREGIEGTGIGLVIVRMLVDRMGGRIDVRSEPGVGTVFELRLRSPEARVAAGGPPAPPPDAVSAPPPAVLRHGTLLYIEDNLVNTLLVQELVGQRPGLRLHCAETGTAGIAEAVRMRPELVLVDMQLPDMDGHEVLRRLRDDPRTAAIPCIALSANAMTEDIERALAAGFSDYWTKPIDLRTFMGSLDALFARHPPGAD